MRGARSLDPRKRERETVVDQAVQRVKSNAIKREEKKEEAARHRDRSRRRNRAPDTRKKAIVLASLERKIEEKEKEKKESNNEPRTRQTRRLYDSLEGVLLALARSLSGSLPSPPSPSRPSAVSPRSRHPRFAREIPPRSSGSLSSSLPSPPHRSAVFPRLSLPLVASPPPLPPPLAPPLPLSPLPPPKPPSLPPPSPLARLGSFSSKRSFVSTSPPVRARSVLSRVTGERKKEQLRHSPSVPTSRRRCRRAPRRGPLTHLPS